MKLADLRGLSKEDLLEALGLEERNLASRVASGVGLFAAGMAVGAGLAMLLSPEKAGERPLSKREREVGERLSQKLEEQAARH